MEVSDAEPRLGLSLYDRYDELIYQVDDQRKLFIKASSCNMLELLVTLTSYMSTLC